MKLKTFLLALFVGLLPTAALAAATAPVIHATGIDLRPLLQEILLAAFSVLSILAVWALRRVGEFVKTKTGVNILEQEQFLRKYLESALQAGLKWASTRIESADWSNVETKHAVVEMAAKYVMDAVPDALAYFKLDRQAVIDRLYARFPDLEITLAQASPTPVVVNNTAAPAAASRTRSK